MRCYICNRALSEKEISLDEQTLKTEPCGECLEVIYDTAYPSGYDPNDDEFVLIDEAVDDTDLRAVVPFFNSRKDLDND
jgi:hypothetical protein